MSKTVRGFIAVTLLIHLWPVPQRLYADPVSVQPVLIYCDSSPGAVALATLWQSTLSAESNEWHLTLSVETFTTQLGGGNWNEVVVLAKYSPETPAYAGALTAYAQAHPDKTINLWFWHDNGEQPDPDKAVLGTTALSMWHRGRTTTAYASAGFGSIDGGSALTANGLLFPSFQGINAVGLTVWKEFTLESAADGSPELFIIIYMPCEQIGLVDYSLAVKACKDNRDAHFEICDDFAPSAGDPGDPTAFDECTELATNNYKNCIKAAVDLYHARVKQCHRHLQQAQEQEAPDPGGG